LVTGPTGDWLISVAHRLHVLRQDLLCRYAIRFETISPLLRKIGQCLGPIGTLLRINDHATTVCDEDLRASRQLAAWFPISTPYCCAAAVIASLTSSGKPSQAWLALDHVKIYRTQISVKVDFTDLIKTSQ
jgi:hypothetical protein